VPERLDLGDVFSAHIRQRLLGETGGDADAQRTGDELQEGEAARRIELVEQVANGGAHLGTAERIHSGDDLAETRLVLVIDFTSFRRAIPDQRDGLGEIADIVVGILEEDGVHAFQHEIAQHGRLDAFQIEPAGECG
jgi:hypothetical protein